jgi:hypothetical protein
MLRLLVLLLVAANLAFLAWSHGWLDDVVGVRATGDREPERLQRQVRPETIRVLQGGSPARAGTAAPGGANAPGPSSAAPGTGSPTSAGGAVAAATSAADTAAPPACLEAGPFNTQQFGAVEALLQLSLPVGSWTHVRNERPSLWMVYVGRLADAESMTRRQEELRRLKVEFEVLRAPGDLVPGLSLGRFEVRGNANNLLEQLAQRGVRGARVVEVPAGGTTHVARIERPTPAVMAQLAGLRADALGKGFQPCPRP